MLSDRTKEEKPLDDKSDIADVQRLNGILLEYRNEVKRVATDLENDIIEDCNDVFEKIMNLFESANESYEIYRVERMKRRFERIEGHISGAFERHVARRISLDDRECSEILRMLPGEAKGQRMQELKKKVFIEVVDDITSKINEVIDELFEDIDDAIQHRLETIGTQLLEKSTVYNELIANGDAKGDVQESIVLNGEYMVSTLELIEELVTQEI